MPQVVGLDIGTSAVRAAELDVNGGRPVLRAFSQVGLPPGVIVDGEIQDASAVSDAIARLWQNGKFTSKSVIVGIAGLRAITRELDLPWVPDDEVDSAVRFQSEEVIPFPADKTILSTQVLSDFDAPDGTTQRHVLVAAAHRDLIDGVVGAVEKAGLHVARVDLVSSALVRALVGSVPQAEQPEAIVSVGAGLTVIVVHQQGRPQFVRTIGMGSNLATNAISSALDLPFADAEAMKRRLGNGESQVRSAERAVQATIGELVGEIRNSIQYFATLPGRSPITAVTITGAGARLWGLVEQLQTQVRIPVRFVSPLTKLDLSGFDLSPEQAASIEPVLAAPIGLALPEPNPAVRKFNLVPPEVLKREQERQLVRYSVIGVAIVVVILAGVSVWRFLQVHNAQNDVATLTTSVAGLNAQIPTFNQVVRANDELHLAQGQILRLDDASVNWPAVLAQLEARTPAGLAVTSFTGTAPAPSSGSASSGTPGASAAAAVGSFTVSVSGSFPASVHFDPAAEWIDSITASPMYEPPSVTGVTNAPAPGGTTVSFSSTVSLKSIALVTKATS
ncbi:MAG TPA: type IV pilus assembly protein PilM [Acidimicrobiales bacterium]|nr:type IV pilus assembly protein PilM [Acidimicrobiales bacterium]